MEVVMGKKVQHNENEEWIRREKIKLRI